MLLSLSVMVNLNPEALAENDVPLCVTPVAPTNVQQRGETVFADFGKAAFANLEIRLPADPPQGILKVRLGEKLAADGTIDRKPPGSVIFRDLTLQTEPRPRVYRLTLPAVKRHEDRSAVHMPADIGDVTPFRYVEIEGSPLPLSADSLRQLFVHAPFNDEAARFECSDPTLNEVWNLCHYTMKATTAFGIYIDGERERIAYEADAYINLLSHYACDLDPRVARATFDRLIRFPTWPTEWSLHMPMIAAADYQATGDPVLARRHYDGLKKKLLSDQARPDGLLRANAIVDWPPVERDGYDDGKPSRFTKPPQSQQIGPEVNTVVNAFYYHALRQMQSLAGATGHSVDAAEFERKAGQVAQAFQQTFFDPHRGIFIDGEGSTHASLHANMFPLAFGLVPPQHLATVTQFIQSRGMACSVYGAQYLLDGLFDADRDDYAISLMTSRSSRSWWGMIEQGSTMTLEAWNAEAKPNLTWNHAWGAAPANVISRHLLGVRPLTPGYKSILIEPKTGSLKWVSGIVPTPFGPVAVRQQTEGGYRLVVEIPSGATAKVVVQTKTAGGQVWMDGQILPDDVTPMQAAFHNVQPGRHVVTRR